MAIPPGRTVRQVGLALALMPLGAGVALAQSDAAFPATNATTSGSAAPVAAPGATPGTPPGTGGTFVVRTPTPLLPPGSLLPFTGNTAQGGGLRGDDTSSLGPPLDRAARNWSVTPSLSLGEEYTSNALASGGNGTGRGYDVVTLVQPSIAVSGVTTRLQGSLSYNPEIDIYARNSGQTRVNQNFGGSVSAAVLPGLVFLDLRAYGGVSTNGVGGTSGTSTAGNNNQTQSLAFSAAPYAVYRLGEYGTAEVGAAVQRSSSTGVGGSNITGVNGSILNAGASNGTPNSPFTNNPFFTTGNQTLTSYSGHAGFQTGEAFDRYNGSVLAYASQYQGSGVLTNSARDTFTIDNGYGLTRLVTLLGRVGYEHIRYSGTTPQRIDDAIWTVGVRLSLGPTSTVELGYGHQDGFNSAKVNVSLQLTARTRLYVQYSEGLNTDAEQLQNALASADFDQIGNPVDHTTGAPLLLSTVGAFGAQDNLYKTRRVSITGTLLKQVDVISASINGEDNRLVSSSGLPNTLGSNQGVYGSVSWTHELSPTLSLSSFGQYGVRSGKQVGTERFLTASVALVKALSETLSAQLRYSYNRTSGGQGFVTQGFVTQPITSTNQSLSNFDQSVILLSATKSF